ncbi:serine/threonine-protein kinase rio2-like isoform X3 [Punica granatum]|nr:serine/threonine-protein kinase rio2-like isoform X3 [Punica granatum]
MVNRGVFASVGRQIGVGKESDIFEVASEDGTILAMKLHRLGRVSFRAVKSKRDYLKHRRSYNWLYLSRLAALKEFSFMKALEEHGFPVPNALDCNRHCVIMSLVPGYPLVQVKELQNPEMVFERIIGLVVCLAEHGLIHCDFNEFNIMIDDDENVAMIDFPQMVSVSHRNAQMYFDRDVECIYKFFGKRFNLSFEEQADHSDSAEEDAEDSSRPCFSSINKTAGFLDKELAASGFTRKDQADMDKFIEEGSDEDAVSGDEEDASDSTEAIVRDTDALHLSEQQPEQIQEGDGADKDETRQRVAASRHESEAQDGSEERGECEEDACDAELVKRLNKQRRRAIAAAHGGRKALASRNSYKDKGGRSSHNSKIQKQLSGW